ncbi:MAG TPA: tripartite tricarboxylate transporter substrate-binding protein [Alphaproteobacteria bacterium]|nr:tripartite tricarboxylate transporter substrate-binding protein [Alphaproteobacteria bacterium]
MAGIGRIGGIGLAAVLATMVAGGAHAQSPAQSLESFYKGKQIQVIIGYSPGGLYDITARLLSRHMPSHIPGKPVMVPQNMPASGSIRAILTLYNVSPKDGTAVGVVARSYAIDPIFNPISEKYDPTRFNPIGSTSSEVSVAVTWFTSPVKTFEDLYTHEVTVGSTGQTDDTARFPTLTKRLTPAKIKIVTGYPGGNDVTMAMEKGEVDGRFGWSWGSIKVRSRDWLEQKKINVILQMALKKAPDLPNTPFIMDYAKTDLDRQALELIFAPQAAAWPMLAPPGLPADRLKALRAAFNATMTDPAFVAEAKKLNVEIEPMPGEEIAAMVERILSFPQAAIDRAKELSAVN